MCKYAQWDEYRLTCGAEINGICTPTPFNFQTIDDFYPEEEAGVLKSEIQKTFPERDTATVVETLMCGNELVENYAKFLFDNDYSLYSAKQWGVAPNEIDPSVLKRVPLRFSYEEGYFDDDFQVMPHVSFTSFFENLLNHGNIEVSLNIDALDYMDVKDAEIYFDGKKANYPVIYSGPLDELFGCCYGRLPYRSLRFEWKHEEKESFQKYPVVAYPQAKDYVRIIEYKKLPIQSVPGTTYEVEYSLPYKIGEHNEPYYPVLTVESLELYEKYRLLSKQVQNLFTCGRLGEFKYYNMDQALEKALDVSRQILKNE